MTRLGPGVRATYLGVPGHIEGDSSLMISPDGSRQRIWHLVYDTPLQTTHPCGCCRPFGEGHRYRGVFTTPEHLVLAGSTSRVNEREENPGQETTVDKR